MYIIIAVLAIISWLFYRICVKPLSHWSNLNIPSHKGWPIVGSLKILITRKQHFLDLLEDMYNEFPNNRYSGMFMMMVPSLIIRDIDLIKKITVKDFDHFTDHRSLETNNNDLLMSKNLITLKGEEWREMRSTLSPSFTSSKMKAMFALMSNCAKNLTSYFKELHKDTLEYEMKDIFGRYANDVIATCAFGIDVDSMRNEKNEFFVMGRDVTNFGAFRTFKMFFYTIVPTVAKTFNLSIFPRYISNFFLDIVRTSISEREAHNIHRPDLIHLLMEARKGRLQLDETKKSENKQDGAGFATVEEVSTVQKTFINKEITDSDIAAQALLFFFAGFETASTMMCFMSHELATNPDIQERLQKEIEEALAESNGEVTYEMIAKMQYLDMVVCETLRKWPISPSLDRLCSKDYLIEPELPNEKPFLVPKGTSLTIPVYGIQRDPKYYPNPSKFDPERFNEENKQQLHNVYMPFGVGPRNCIGSRFALLEIKVLFIHLLSQFNFVVIKDTLVPLVLDKRQMKLTPKNGFWLGLQHRKNK